jgi:hypothetical protein
VGQLPLSSQIQKQSFAFDPIASSSLSVDSLTYTLFVSQLEQFQAA